MSEENCCNKEINDDAPCVCGHNGDQHSCRDQQLRRWQCLVCDCKQYSRADMQRRFGMWGVFEKEVREKAAELMKSEDGKYLLPEEVRAFIATGRELMIDDASWTFKCPKAHLVVGEKTYLLSRIDLYGQCGTYSCNKTLDEYAKSAIYGAILSESRSTLVIIDCLTDG